MGIGKRLKKRRLELDLTRVQLAEKVHVTPSAIANYENEISYPKLDIMISLIQDMKIDANYLFQDYLTTDVCSNLAVQKEYGRELSEVEKDSIRKYRLLGEDEKRLIQLIIDKEYESVLSNGFLSLPCRLPGERKLHAGFLLQERISQAQVPKKYVPDHTDFCFQIRLDRYRPIYKNYDLLALKEAPAGHNEIGLFCVNGICYIRIFCITETSMFLRSLNVTEPDIILKDSDHFQCMGTVLDKIYGDYDIT